MPGCLRLFIPCKMLSDNHFTPYLLVLLPSSLSFVPTGTLYARVQIQGVGVRELLCDILLHDISAAAVGQGLVPRSEQRGRNHEGEPRQEEQASSPLPSQTSKR